MRQSPIRFLFLLALPAIAALYPAAISAQTPGSIRGQVTDPSAAVVPGATVAITGSNVSRSVKSDYGAVNHLAVEVRDKSIVAYVNGRPVATAELPADGAGTVGLYVDQRGMEVVFSNLRVVELVPMR